MDTSELEKFCLSITDADSANGLLAAVRQRALLFELDPSAAKQAPAEADAAAGRVLSAREKAQRARLMAQIDGSPECYEELLREAAYTWFNRIVAIRFMEVNDYLPAHVRMFSQPGQPDKTWAGRPQCLSEAASLGLPGLDAAAIVPLMDGAHDEELFRRVLVATCEQLHEVMPTVFGAVEAADELLLPDRLLAEGGLVRRLVSEVSEGMWLEPDGEGTPGEGGVEVLGWLYQFYVAREKDDAFASFKKGKKATPEKIGPATQLFTPSWIVRYMVQNSLGRLWMLNNPGSRLAEQMEFYIPPEGDPGAFVHIGSPEDISLADPACGSGHILVYAFDLLLEMYRERGYRDRDAVAAILGKNLHGMEIDRRAAQVAELALTMKARKADRRLFTRQGAPRPDICVLEPIAIDVADLPFGCMLSHDEALLDALAHLTECGSLLAPTTSELADLRAALKACGDDIRYSAVRGQLERALCVCEKLARTYTVVVANPPYMGSSNFDPWTSAWIKKHYADVKSDLCTCFIERCRSMGVPDGCSATVTSCTWMFISSFEKLRQILTEQSTILSLLHTAGPNNHPDVFDANAVMILSNSYRPGVKGAYFKLNKLGLDVKERMTLEAIQNPACGWFYRADAATFKDIPGTPIAYWASEAMRRAFAGNVLGDYLDTSLGMATCDNERFLRLWWEIENDKRSIPDKNIDFSKKWFPYNKGGYFRKWYGNDEYLVNWANHGAEVQAVSIAVGNPNRFFRKMISWTRVSSSVLHARFKPAGYLYDMTGPVAVSTNEDVLLYALAYLDSNIGMIFARFLSASLDFQPGQVASYPLIISDDKKTNIVTLASENICLSKSDWDSFETSWDFERHPLV